MTCREYNNLSQLTATHTYGYRSDGFITSWQRTCDGTIEHQGGAVHTFEAWPQLADGIHEVEITATDGNQNAATKTYEVTVAGGSSETLTYDLNGNLISRTAGTEVTTYDWDALNQLIAIHYPDGGKTEFVYDGLGRRVQIIEKEWDPGNSSFIINNSSLFIWDGMEIIEERNGATNAVVKRFFDHGFEVVSGPDAGDYFTTFDHLGSIREVVDDTEAVVTRYDYDPYGNMEKIFGLVESDFLFTGHFHHARSGLHLAPFRAYDPEMGRWLSRDPLGFVDGPNLYAYVLNNPINLWDPLGLCNNSRWKNAWNKFKETSSGEFGVGLGLGIDAKFGKLRGQVGVEGSLSGGSNLTGEYKTTSQGNVGGSLSYGDHTIGANYGGSAYLGGSSGGGSSSNSVFGYSNEPSGFKTSNTSIGVGATAGLVRAGVSADPYAVIRELFRDPNSDCDR